MLAPIRRAFITSRATFAVHLRACLAIVLAVSILGATIPRVIGHSHELAGHEHHEGPQHARDDFNDPPPPGEPDERWHLHDATLLCHVPVLAGVWIDPVVIPARGAEPPNPLVTAPQPGRIDLPLRPPPSTRPA